MTQTDRLRQSDHINSHNTELKHNNKDGDVECAAVFSHCMNDAAISEEGLINSLLNLV